MSDITQLIEDGRYLFRREPDGSLEPIRKGVYPTRQPCSTHGDHDAGMDGRCVRCRQRICPPTILIIED